MKRMNTIFMLVIALVSSSLMQAYLKPKKPALPKEPSHVVPAEADYIIVGCGSRPIGPVWTLEIKSPVGKSTRTDKVYSLGRIEELKQEHGQENVKVIDFRNE